MKKNGWQISEIFFYAKTYRIIPAYNTLVPNVTYSLVSLMHCPTDGDVHCSIVVNKLQLLRRKEPCAD